MFKYTEEEIKAKVIDIINKYPIRTLPDSYIVDIHVGYGTRLRVCEDKVQYTEADWFEYTTLPISEALAAEIYHHIGCLRVKQHTDHVNSLLDDLMRR